MSTSGIPASRDDFARWCEAEGIHTVVAGAADTHGIWRGKRLGVAKGKFTVPDTIDEDEAAIAAMFTGPTT